MVAAEMFQQDVRYIVSHTTTHNTTMQTHLITTTNNIQNTFYVEVRLPCPCVQGYGQIRSERHGARNVPPVCQPL